MLALPIRAPTRAFAGQHCNVNVFLGDLLIPIGRNRKFVAAFAHREFIERVDVVVRDTDHGRAQGFKLVRGLGEVMRLDGATRSEGRRIEVQDHGTFLQRIGQRKRKWLAGEASPAW